MPSGDLKKCMDAASPSEQAFAMRVAIASKSIQEWLEELSTWPWPTHKTSAGFERPPAKRRKLFTEKLASNTDLDIREADGTYEKSFLGSLLHTDVAKYEKRIDEMEGDMEDLNVEEIKSHILHNHIMPLSRPGTPVSDSFRSSTLSASTYARMDDFTALITATIVQALPNLSRLTRLLNTWSIRLLVLRKSSDFMIALEDAETALKAGWTAMGTAPDKEVPGVERASQPGGSALSRSEFNVMKMVVERTVANAGQYLDVMLDTMEGREDTLPEEWIDRMDKIEHDYAEWAAACEGQIKEAEWARIAGKIWAAGSSLPSDVRDKTSSLPSEKALLTGVTLGDDPVSGPTPLVGDVHGGNDTYNGFVASDITAQPHARSRHVAVDTNQGHEHLITSDAAAGTGPPVIMVHPATEDFTATETLTLKSSRPEEKLNTEEISDSQPTQLSDIAESDVPRFNGLDDTEPPVKLDTSQAIPDGSRDQGTPSTTDSTGHLDATDRPERAPDTGASDVVQGSQVESDRCSPHAEDNDEDLDSEFPDSEFPEPELPMLPHERRGSEVSNTSTVVHGQQSGFAGLSSDPPDQGTPDYRRFRDIVLPSTEADGVGFVDELDLPSSPPDFRSSARSLSVSFNDIPTVIEAAEEGTPPETPQDVSFTVDDDIPEEVYRHDSSSRSGVARADDQLQQQISEILDSIPAQIRLTSEYSAINLNPPDFNMPTTRAKVKGDSLPPRSYSSMSKRSSRAGTPSFTLAPAKKPRHQAGNQEIKLYHLSRSNGEPPIKLFIRCVGDNGERVMVRVGGGWADLGEYLKDYASHHGRRGGDAKVEVRDLPRISTADRAGSSPPSRPASAMDFSSPVTPLNVRKARRSIGATFGEEFKFAARQPFPKTPLAQTAATDNTTTPPSSGSSRSRSSSRLSWTEEDSSLGMAGPKSKHIEMSEEKKAWVESMKQKVRIASGDQRAAQVLAKSPAVTARAATPDPKMLLSKSPAFGRAATPDPNLLLSKYPAFGRAATPDPKLPPDGKFGELGKVGSTKRLFLRKGGGGTGAGSGK